MCRSRDCVRLLQGEGAKEGGKKWRGWRVGGWVSGSEKETEGGICAQTWCERRLRVLTPYRPTKVAGAVALRSARLLRSLNGG